MAVSYMNKTVIDPYGNIRYEYKESLTYVSAELKSNPVIVPGGNNEVTVTLLIGGSSSGSIETTNNPLSEVIADASACTWATWTKGTITSTAQDTFAGKMTAFRIVCTTGTVTAFVNA